MIHGRRPTGRLQILFAVLSATALLALASPSFAAPNAVVEPALESGSSAVSATSEALRGRLSTVSRSVTVPPTSVTPEPPKVQEAVESLGTATEPALQKAGTQSPVNTIEGVTQSVVAEPPVKRATESLEVSWRVTPAPVGGGVPPAPDGFTAPEVIDGHGSHGAGVPVLSPTPPSEVGPAAMATSASRTAADSDRVAIVYPKADDTGRSTSATSGRSSPASTPGELPQRPAHGAGPGSGGGGPSAPPLIAMLLLTTLAIPILLRSFKEAPASLQPAPFVALLERPG
jgi:hypothetical protein